MPIFNRLTLVVLIVILGSSLTPDSKCNTNRTFFLNQLNGQASYLENDTNAGVSYLMIQMKLMSHDWSQSKLIANNHLKDINCIRDRL